MVVTLTEDYSDYADGQALDVILSQLMGAEFELVENEVITRPDYGILTALENPRKSRIWLHVQPGYPDPRNLKLLLTQAYKVLSYVRPAEAADGIANKLIPAADPETFRLLELLEDDANAHLIVGLLRDGGSLLSGVRRSQVFLDLRTLLPDVGPNSLQVLLSLIDTADEPPFYLFKQAVVQTLPLARERHRCLKRNGPYCVKCGGAACIVAESIT